MNYKISIIIPIFNVENYIKDALESIVRQTIGLEQLEIIMVDDCSTDKSGEIIDEYANKYENFKIINLPENSGAAGKPRNIGMKNATGKYLMFLDPDDYYTDDACETLYNKIIEKNVDIAFGKYNIINKQEVREVNFENRGFKDIEELEVRTVDENTNLLRLVPSVWTKIIKRSIIEDNNIIFPEGIPGQDVGFVLHTLLKAKGIVFINRSVVNYRIRNKSITFNRTKKYMVGLSQAYQYASDICKLCNKEEYFLFIIRDHLIYWMEQFILSDMNNSEKKEVLRLSWSLFNKYCEYGLTPPNHLLLFFKSIINKEYDETILLADKLKGSKENPEKDDNKLKSKRKQKKIFMLCDMIHVKLGGLARVLLNRSRLLVERGYDVSILTIGPAYNYDIIEKEMRKERQLAHDVDLINIYKYYKDKNTQKKSFKCPESVKKISEIHENGYHVIDEYETKRIARYFREGNYLKLKKWKKDGSLEYIDYFSQNGVKIKEELYSDGFLVIEISYDSHRIRQKRHFTKDGFCYLIELFNHNRHEESLFLFDKTKNDVLHFKNSAEFHKHFLTELCLLCEEKPYLICDGSGPTPSIANIDSNIAYKIAQLHANPYTGPYCFGSPMRKLGILNGIEKIDAFITLTENQRKDIIKEFGDYSNTYVIPNFVVKNEMLKLEKIPNKISIFTRIVYEKNLEDAIKSFKLVVNKRKNAKLEIFGRAILPAEIEELNKIKELIKKLKLEENVLIKGYTTDVYKEMEESVATLLTSRSEGFGMVILESMLNSTPTISYDINYGPSDIIDHGVNGFLVEHGNIEQMARYIIELLDDTEKAKKMGVAARKKVLENYTDKVVIPKWENLFKIVSNDNPITNISIHKEKEPNSKFYILYILFNKKNHGIKNILLNIKGYNAIKKNHLLDTNYYLINNGDVRIKGKDPILHYMYHGFKEGRKPNPVFDGDYYLKKYEDVKKSNLNPLVHYSLYGINENRKIKKT